MHQYTRGRRAVEGAPGQLGGRGRAIQPRHESQPGDANWSGRSAAVPGRASGRDAAGPHGPRIRQRQTMRLLKGGAQAPEPSQQQTPTDIAHAMVSRAHVGPIGPRS
eukprot:1228890-Pyramimonas_sp.AAC.1